jgi:CRP/FNR family cyclic AMP-dependent transcriptional regulator
MVPLRVVAIASNITFLAYGLSFQLWPVAILHMLLLPLNTLRLVQIRQMLRAINVARFSDIKIEMLARHFSPAKYARGETIFHKGELGDSAYFVVKGDIQFPELGVLCHSGDLFGEIALFSPDHVRTASAVCATDVELYRIDEHAVAMVSYQDPAMAFALLRLVTRRLLENCSNLETELARFQPAMRY